jgi:hypothetical protein
MRVGVEDADRAGWASPAIASLPTRDPDHAARDRMPAPEPDAEEAAGDSGEHERPEDPTGCVFQDVGQDRSACSSIWRRSRYSSGVISPRA